MLGCRDFFFFKKSLGRASGRLRRRRGRWGSSTVQILYIEHGELSALLRDTVEDQITFVILEDLLNVLQVLVRLLDQSSGPERESTKGVNSSLSFRIFLSSQLAGGKNP